MNDQLLQSLFEANNYTIYFKEKGISIPKETPRLVRSLYQKDLDDSLKITKYDFRNGQLSYFYNYWKCEDIGRKILLANFVRPPILNANQVQSLVRDVFNIDRRVKSAHFYVSKKSRLYRQLLNLGAFSNGEHLFAIVNESKKHLKAYEYDKNIQIRDMKRKDFQEVIELECLAQRSSETTRCGSIPRKEVVKFFNFLLKDRHKVLLAIEDGVIIGLISPSINKTNIGHIMTISVHPEHQKRGVSKLLYLHAMNYYQKNGVKVYSGVSTTAEVLNSSRSIGREARYTYLELSRTQYL